ncbi:hypothetical protein ABPG72_016350 [Tetrahymena utriculariae]
MSHLFMAYIPFSYKIASLIVERDNLKQQNSFQEFYEKDNNNNTNLERIIRLNIFDNIESQKQNEKRYIKFLNLITNKNISQQNKFIFSKKETDGLNQNFQMKQYLIKNGISEGQNQLKDKNNNQKTYWFENVTELKQIEKNIIKLLKDQVMKISNNQKRNKKIKTNIVFTIFIFLIEISQSYRIYFLMHLQLIKSNNLSLKQQQILNSIHQIFLKKRSVIRKRMGSENPFDSSYLQVIIFENKLEKSYSLLYFTINQKLQVLNMMKQKYIIATELISKVESMQRQINQLKKNLNYLIQLNGESLDLLNLQALFLENLSFSEKDINLLQINKFKRKKYDQLKYIKHQNKTLTNSTNEDTFNEKSCVIFASYKDSKSMIIDQVSSNFSNLFCYSKKEHIKGLKIETIIPLAFQDIHKIFIRQYLEEQISIDIYQNSIQQQQVYNKYINETQNDLKEITPFDQGYNYQFNSSKYQQKKGSEINYYSYGLDGCKMNQQIIFASLNQMFILPIKIDIKTNEYQENEIFGLVAKVKQVNEEYQYILYNETDLSVIGLTEYMHKIFFSNCKNLQQINLRYVFPFLIGTKNKTKNEEHPDQKNETVHDASNNKYQFDVNLTDGMQHNLRENEKNKFSYIAIHGGIKNNTLNTTSQSTKYLSKAISYQEASSINFTQIELFVRKIMYKGVENMSYIEIVKMRQLNPESQAPKILQEITNKKKQYIYSQMFEDSNEQQNIISDLELYINNHSHSQFNTFRSENQHDCSNYYQQQLLLKEIGNPIHFTQTDFNKAQQILLNQQTDQSTNLVQIKMMTNRIENDNLDSQYEESSRFAYKQFGEQKASYKQSEISQPSQYYQLQNNTVPDQTLYQLIQENQITNREQHMKSDFANKNSNIQNIQEYQLSGFNIYEQHTLQKENQSQCINIFNSQQYLSYAYLSDQNLNTEQIKSLEQISNKVKENVQLDNEQMNQKQKTPSNILNNMKKQTIFKSNIFNKNKINNIHVNALNNKKNQQFIKNPDQDSQDNQKDTDKYSKTFKVQDVKYNIASSNSQSSYYTPSRSKLYQIMADDQTLKVIKVINLIGFICYSVMIYITLLQFSQLQSYMALANQDYEDFLWPTSYSSSLSAILKYKNIQQLTNYTKMNFISSYEKDIFYNQMQAKAEETFQLVLSLLSLVDYVSTDRYIFSHVIDYQSTYFFAKLYDEELLSSTPSDRIVLVTFNHTVTLQNNMILTISNIFRYIQNLGSGRPEYLLIKNQLQQISYLKDLQNGIKDTQQELQDYFQNQLLTIMIVLIIINTCCVGIIIPLYYYIQKERDAIIQLFTRFPVSKLDDLIKKIQDSTNTKSIYQNQSNQIIQNTIASLYGFESQKNIKKQTKVQQLRSYLMENIAMHFNILAMKARPNLKPMKPEIYYDYLQSLIDKQEDLNNDIQWVIKSQYSEQRFNQELYDEFFFSAFKTNLCENFKNFPEFNTDPNNINVDLCDSAHSILLQQGFQVAYKSLFSIFKDLHSIYIIQDERESMHKRSEDNSQQQQSESRQDRGLIHKKSKLILKNKLILKYSMIT